MKTSSWIFCLFLVLRATGLADTSCEKLSALKIPNTTITTAQSVAAGSFVGPPEPFSGRDIAALYKTLPAFCRIVAQAKPTTDSDIKLEVWLPDSG
jgi:feruloyl esterase